jgi:hypothetical protein
MKVAVVLRCITGQLRTYILQLSEGLKDDEFREFFVKWDRSQQKWSHLLSTPEESPMEISSHAVRARQRQERKKWTERQGQERRWKVWKVKGRQGQDFNWEHFNLEHRKKEEG